MSAAPGRGLLGAEHDRTSQLELTLALITLGAAIWSNLNASDGQRQFWLRSMPLGDRQVSPGSHAAR